jgi:hypothetical protein
MRAIKVCKRELARFDGTTVIIQFRRKPGTQEVIASAFRLDFGPDAADVANLLRQVVAEQRRPHRRPGQHRGIALLSAVVDPHTAAPHDLAPQQLAPYFGYLPRRTRDHRVAVGIMSSGWRFRIDRDVATNSTGLDSSEPGEGGAASVVTVFEPGDEWSEHMDVVAPLTALNATYATLG